MKGLFLKSRILSQVLVYDEKFDEGSCFKTTKKVNGFLKDFKNLQFSIKFTVYIIIFELCVCIYMCLYVMNIHYVSEEVTNVNDISSDTGKLKFIKMHGFIKCSSVNLHFHW